MSDRTVKIELVSGCEGYSIYIDDCRVAGAKPWGGGRTVKQWTAKVSKIDEALGRSDGMMRGEVNGKPI